MVNSKLERLKIVAVFILLILICHGCKPQNVSFIPLKQFDSQDTVMFNGNQVINKSDNYIVINYKDNSSTIIKSMDSIAFEKANYMRGYSHYVIFFYKASDKTNIKHLKMNPRDFDRYTATDDLVYSYSWIGGKFASRTKYKNGVIIEPKSNIRIE